MKYEIISDLYYVLVVVQYLMSYLFTSHHMEKTDAGPVASESEK